MILAAAAAMFLICSCDPSEGKEQGEFTGEDGLIEAPINQEGSALNGRWEQVAGDYCSALSFEVPGGVKQYLYGWAQEGGPVSFYYDVDPGDYFIGIDPRPVPFVKSYHLKSNPNYGAWLMSQDFGYFYIIEENGMLLTTIEWDLDEIPFEKGAQILWDFRDKKLKNLYIWDNTEYEGDDEEEEYYDDSEESDEPELWGAAFKKVNKFSVIDLSKNRIMGFHSYEMLGFYDIPCECIPFDYGYVESDENKFSLIFGQTLTKYIYLDIWASESLYGKEIELPLRPEEWKAKYGDATFKIELGWVSNDALGVYYTLTNDDMTAYFGDSDDEINQIENYHPAYMTIDYDKTTMHLKFDFNDAWDEQDNISVDAKVDYYNEVN